MATLVTLQGTDELSASRSDINTNFSNLNTDKIEAGSSDTLTNKTINLANNTVTGTTAEFNTALSDGSFATGGGTATGTNTGDQTITLTGDVTGSGTGSFATTIASDSVTYDKMQDTSGTDKLLGRSTAGAGTIEEITCTAAGRAILDDADASAQRTTLGLTIGTDVQAYDNDLSDIAALTHTKGNVMVSNGTDWINVGVGTNDQVLTADSTQASGVKWADAGGSASFNGINGQTIQVLGDVSSISGEIGRLTAFASGTFAEMQISTTGRTSGTLTVTVKKNGTSIGTATITSATSATNGIYIGTSTDLADAFVANDDITIEVSDTGTGSTDLLVNIK